MQPIYQVKDGGLLLLVAPMVPSKGRLTCHHRNLRVLGVWVARQRSSLLATLAKWDKALRLDMSNASHTPQDEKEVQVFFHRKVPVSPNVQQQPAEQKASLLKQVLFSILYLALTASFFGAVIAGLMFSAYFWYFLISTVIVGFILNQVKEDESTKRAEVSLQRFGERAITAVGMLVVVLPMMIVAGIGFPIVAVGGVVVGLSQNNLLLVGFGILIGFVWYVLFAETIQDIPGSFKKMQQKFLKKK